MWVGERVEEEEGREKERSKMGDTDVGRKRAHEKGEDFCSMSSFRDSGLSIL
jgi:hypothetical protein